MSEAVVRPARSLGLCQHHRPHRRPRADAAAGAAVAPRRSGAPSAACWPSSRPPSTCMRTGVGIWGVDIPVGWGFAIANCVWWIGIGHAGTFISAVLLLLRQKWRTSINRFAEAMTLFAATMASIFPLLHLGRAWKAYWLAPYPDTMGLWPQWRSPLVWDFFAIATYIIVSFLFWYLGMIPDLATLRDRAHGRRAPMGVRAGGPRLARRGASMDAPRAPLPAAGRAGDAARGVGAFGGVARLRHRQHAGLPLDDLPALLRRRRPVLGLRDGAHAGHPAAAGLRLAGLHHRGPSGPCGQGDARHQFAGRLWLPQRGLHGLLQRRPLRHRHDRRSLDRLLCAGVLDHARASMCWCRSCCGGDVAGAAHCCSSC